MPFDKVSAYYDQFTFICHCRVCSVQQTVTKSRSESFILAGQIGYRLAYEVDTVSVLRCCSGYDADFKEVGDTCIRKYWVLKLLTVLHTRHVTVESTFYS